MLFPTIQPDDFTHIDSWIDMALLAETATAVVAFLAAEGEAEALQAVRIMNHPGITRVRTAALAKYTKTHLKRWTRRASCLSPQEYILSLSQSAPDCLAGSLQRRKSP